MVEGRDQGCRTHEKSPHAGGLAKATPRLHGWWGKPRDVLTARMPVACMRPGGQLGRFIWQDVGVLDT